MVLTYIWSNVVTGWCLGALVGLWRGVISGIAAVVCLGALTTAHRDESDPGPSRQGFPVAVGTATHPIPEKPVDKTSSGTGFWHAQGGQLVDATGMPVRMTGVNWLGPETYLFTFGGLDVRNYRDMVKQMADLGYNTIRVPYSNQMLDAKNAPSGVNPAINPDLRGLSGLEILDKVIEQAGQNGMRVLLDRHRPDAGGQSASWYTRAYPESRWIDDWRMLAKRYKGNPTVIGAELHNEPNGGDDPKGVCWGCGETTRDWRLAAERAGNAILDVNPDWLIVVNGVDCAKVGDERTCTWRGGNLMAAEKFPVELSKKDKLVYSAHDYGTSVYGNEWLYARDFPANMPALWDKWWGYLDKDNVAPVVITEFGSTFKDPRNEVWLRTLMDYLGTGPTGIDFCFWVWNPQSSDTDGLLDKDWKSVNTAHESHLAPYLIPP